MLAPLLAKDSGLTVDEGFGEARTYKNTVELTLDAEKCSIHLIGTITEEGRMRIVKVNDYWLDFVPNGKLILFQNHDRPGVIGKIGNILATEDQHRKLRTGKEGQQRARARSAWKWTAI